jgi:hypothetical protein
MSVLVSSARLFQTGKLAYKLCIFFYQKPLAAGTPVII